MILTGLVRLGRDAELRFTASQTPVCSLAMAFNYGKKGDDGNKPSQWVDAALWGKQAEALAQYLTKGTQLNVVLSDVHIETFQTQTGEKSKLVGRVDSVEFVGKSNQAQPAANAAPRQSTPQQSPSAAYDDFDDELPF